MTYLDISKNINLKYLDCHQNQISYLDLKNNILLEYLDCNRNNLTYLDISQNLELRFLDCSSNKITFLNLYYNLSKLNILACYRNKLTVLDTTYCTNLKIMSCTDNLLNNIYISTSVEFLYCDNNNLTNLNLYGVNKITRIWAQNNKIKSLDLSTFKNLVQIAIYNNELEYLNVKNNNNLNFNNSAYYAFDSRQNPNLKCVQVDNVTFSNESMFWWKDSQTIYSTDCSSTLSINQIQKSQTKIYPNPVKNILNIQTENKFQKAEIYSSNGQLIKTSFLKETDVANLPKGNYILKITTDKGVQTEKFIKE